MDPATGAWLPNEFGDGVGETLGQVVDDWGPPDRALKKLPSGLRGGMSCCTRR
ncbi:hypothetical protein [Mycobacterium sp.]|uniref:hypothetical protein n=1 Tax=Mycobacterium sp. TaxID=1785 RepID=UPI003F98E0E7